MPERLRLLHPAQHRHEIHTVISVRMGEADEMQCPLPDDIENAWTRFARRGMCIHHAKAATGEGDDNRVAASGFVEINP